MITSNFRSNEMDAAWWEYVLPSGRRQICATNGATIVARLASALGVSSGPAGLEWGDALQSALLRSVSARQGAEWNSLKQEIRQDLADNALSTYSVTYALFILYYEPNGLRLDAIRVPLDAVLPAYGSGGMPSVDPRPGLVCYDPAVDVSPEAQSDAARDVIKQQSRYGIRLHAGESLPAQPVVGGGPVGLTPFGAGASIVLIGIVATMIVWQTKP